MSVGERDSADQCPSRGAPADNVQKALASVFHEVA